MKLKVDAAGNAVVQDGKPVYVHDDGKEIAFDAPAAVAKIKSVSEERDDWRTRAGNAATALEPFKDLDPKAAREAVEKLKSIDQKKLLDAGAVEELKKQIAADTGAAWEQKLKDAQAAITKAGEELATEKATTRKLVLGGRFAKSPYFAPSPDGKTPPRTFLTPEIALRFLGDYFEPTADGKDFVAKLNGRELLSREKPGEVATFDEAVAILIDQMPDKGSILRDMSGSGAGAIGSASRFTQTKEMEGLSPEERLARSFGATA